MESVKKTGRAVVVHEAQVTSGFGGEIAARIMEDDFLSLQAPVVRVGGFDIPYPPAKLRTFTSRTSTASWTPSIRC